VVVGALVMVMVLSNREVNTPEGLGVVTSLDDYTKAIEMAHGLTKPIFDKADNGEELSRDEKEQLLRAAALIDNADRFLPDRTIPFLGAGKAYLLAGDLEMAEIRLRQCIDNARFDKTPGAKETGYEAYFRLSQARFQLGDYEGARDAATEAIKGEPAGVMYLLARARALIQLKKYVDADKDIHAVAALDKTNKEAESLHKLLEAEDPKTFAKTAKH
jgi:tetratricopeptide (TPR) repeat protein